VVRFWTLLIDKATLSEAAWGANGLPVLHSEELTSKGQVTIPRDVRQKLGIFPHTEVDFVVEGNTAILRKIESGETRGKRVVDALRGKATVWMTTGEIMELTRGEG
jgi:AbrB family looped-hinge helix DNA binding protein